jgi:homocysteine S-methyltransferase
MAVSERILSGPVLAEASIFERLRRAPDVAFDPEVGVGGLVADQEGAALLSDIHRSYLRVGRAQGLPVLLQTDTWRAHPLRIERSAFAGRDLNGEHVALLRALRDAEGESADEVLIGGLVGPLGDGYGADGAPSREDAGRLLRPQADALAQAGADLLVAATLPDGDEAMGIADALAATGLPYLIGVVVRPDGTLLDGTRLASFVETLDATTDTPPLGYALTCVHPDVASAALVAEPIGDRAVALFANTSARSPEELDGLDHLETAEAEGFADAVVRAQAAHGLRIVGGCCGTDESHLAAIARRLSRP